MLYSSGPDAALLVHLPTSILKGDVSPHTFKLTSKIFHRKLKLLKYVFSVVL